MGRRTALAEQDYARRTPLWDKNTPGAHDAVVEDGMLYEPRYSEATSGPAWSPTSTHSSTRPCAATPAGSRSQTFTPEQMAGSWTPDYHLGLDGGIVTGPTSYS
jgi:hypothetical protein